MKLFNLILAVLWLPLLSFAGGGGADDRETDENTTLEIAFEAHRNGDGVELLWVYSGFAKAFYIERSLDRENWLAVLSMQGALNTDYVVEYFDIDSDVPTAKLFYRVKRIGYDGSFDYSQTSFVPSFDDLSMYDERTIKTITDPIKKGSRIGLEFASFAKENLLLVVRDNCGKEYFAKVTYLEDLGTYEVIDVSQDIPSGQYLITASSKKGIYSSKLNIEFQR